MTGFDYGRMRATAERLIARFGKPAVLMSRAADGNDRPWNTDGAGTPVAITVVADSYSAVEADGQLVRLTDVKLLVAPGAIAPKVADAVQMDGNSYSVISVTDNKPGPVLLYWEVQARR